MLLPTKSAAKRKIDGESTGGCTCLQGLEHGTVKAGSRLLVHAGAGGVGIFVIQFAKVQSSCPPVACLLPCRCRLPKAVGSTTDMMQARGAHVVSTAGPTNQEFLKVTTPSCCSALPLHL